MHNIFLVNLLLLFWCSSLCSSCFKLDIIKVNNLDVQIWLVCFSLVLFFFCPVWSESETSSQSEPLEIRERESESQWVIWSRLIACIGRLPAEHRNSRISTQVRRSLHGKWKFYWWSPNISPPLHLVVCFFESDIKLWSVSNPLEKSTDRNLPLFAFLCVFFSLQGEIFENMQAFC